MSPDLRDFDRAHRDRVPRAVQAEEPPDPPAIRLLGPDAVVKDSGRVADWVEELGHAAMTLRTIGLNAGLVNGKGRDYHHSFLG